MSLHIHSLPKLFHLDATPGCLKCVVDYERGADKKLIVVFHQKELTKFSRFSQIYSLSLLAPPSSPVLLPCPPPQYRVMILQQSLNPCPIPASEVNKVNQGCLLYCIYSSCPLPSSRNPLLYSTVFELCCCCFLLFIQVVSRKGVSRVDHAPNLQVSGRFKEGSPLLN